MIKKLFLLILIHILSFGVNIASDTLKNIENKYSVALTPQYGFIAPHHSYMKYYITSHVPAFSLELSQKANGSNEWHNYFGFPQTGIGYFYADFGNDILGSTHAIYSFINFPIVKKQVFRFNIRLASGLAYMTHRFDSDENYLNTAISSHLNYYFNLSFNTKFKINEKLLIGPSVSLSHFSNGAVKKPNLGLNLFTAGLGFSYSIGKQNIEPQFKSEFIKNSNILIEYSAGSKQTFAYDDKNYFISSISINYLRDFTYKSSFNLGTDFFYDQSLKTIFEKDEQVFNPSYYYRVGVHVGYELKISRLSIIFQVGSYIISKWKGNGWMYDRLGLRYQIAKNVSTHVLLKSHLEKADFVEWGVGYKFGRK